MSAANKSILIEKGARFSQRLKWRDSKKKPISLSGYEGRMHIRSSVDSPDIEVELSTGNGRVLIEPDSETGVIELYIGATVTEAITISTGVYDLEIFSTTNPDDVIRIMEGEVEVKPEVTR